MGIGYLYITGKQNDKHILDCKIQTMKFVKKNENGKVGWNRSKIARHFMEEKKEYFECWC